MSTKLPFGLNQRPRSFKDRGVAMPFTTPLLTGARFRRTETVLAYPGERGMIGGRSGLEQMHRSPLEIIVRNPSSGRGVYILPWGQIDSMCRPTMHDTMLGQVIGQGGNHFGMALRPDLAQAAARQVAMQGLAGPLAAEAATLSARAQATRLIATRLTMLMDLIEQTEQASAGQVPLFQETYLGIERRGAKALENLAPGLGQPSATIKNALESLAIHYVDIGVGFAANTARLPTLLASVSSLRHDILAWTQHASKTDAKLARHDCHHAMAIASAAHLILRMAAVPLAEAGTRVQNMVSLLQEQLARPVELAERLARTSWLLDGWEQIILVWQSTSPLFSRSDALREINDQLPILPGEVEAWQGFPSGPTRLHLARTTQRGAQAI